MPQRWRSDTGDGRNVFAQNPEHLSDEAVRCPVRQADLAARAADAQQFAGSLLLVGREHDAEGGEHDIEARIGEGQCLGIGFLEGDRQAVGFGAAASALEKGADIVGRHDVGEAAGRRQRGVAVAGGDIEDALVAAQVDGLAQDLADDLQRGADDGVVAGAPGELLAALDGGQVDGGDGRLNVHWSAPLSSFRHVVAARWSTT